MKKGIFFAAISVVLLGTMAASASAARFCTFGGSAGSHNGTCSGAFAVNIKGYNDISFDENSKEICGSYEKNVGLADGNRNNICDYPITNENGSFTDQGCGEICDYFVKSYDCADENSNSICGDDRSSGNCVYTDCDGICDYCRKNPDCAGEKCNNMCGTDYCRGNCVDIDCDGICDFRGANENGCFIGTDCDKAFGHHGHSHSSVDTSSNGICGNCRTDCNIDTGCGHGKGRDCGRR